MGEETLIMRFLSLFVFLLFGFVSSWAGYRTIPLQFNPYNQSCPYVANPQEFPAGVTSISAPEGMASCNGDCQTITIVPQITVDGRLDKCELTSNNTCYGIRLSCRYCVTEQCPVGKEFSFEYCSCVEPPPPPADTNFVCQNSGGPTEGGFGGPYVAKLFRCVTPSGGEQVCTNTRDLAGTCQDWGYCGENQSDCVISDSKGKPPCGRSGPTFTTASRCYYACADGKDLSCLPTSTGYVAGNIYAGQCPSEPPDGCRPSASSSSSGSSGGSSSASSSSSGSSGGSTAPPSDTITFPQGDNSQIDYTLILQAIHDTLHRANVQRDYLLELQNVVNFDLDNISNFSEYIYSSVDGVEGALRTGNSSLSTIATATTDFNNSLSTLQENGFNLVSSTANDISQSHELLDEINRYLRSDSLYTALPLDTVYNPLLRDIKGAIDSINTGHDTTRFVRDSAFARWFAAYYSDTASRAGVLGDIYGNTKTLAGDSSKNSSCAAFLSCYTPNPTLANAQACAVSTGGSLETCVDGGSPLDNLVNVELGVLKTLWDGLFGSDSTVTDTQSSDTNVVFSPAKDSATNSMMGAISALFSSDSTASILNKVKDMKDSIEKLNNDSTVIQPDSLVLDSSEAAQYVQNLLLVPGTSEDCFICHADLGTFGGLAPNGLSIHIDFADFGGFNFCALIRAVVKIASLVVCISLTLGSWLAAFGYNPKNDA